MPELPVQVASHDVVSIVFLVLAFVAGMTVWLTLQWRLHKRTEFEVALKRDMLARGMSVADIERVLRASVTFVPDEPETSETPVSHTGIRADPASLHRR